MVRLAFAIRGKEEVVIPLLLQNIGPVVTRLRGAGGHAIASKNTQAQGIVLDLSNSSVTPDQLGNLLQKIRGAGTTNITDIKIIGK